MVCLSILSVILEGAAVHKDQLGHFGGYVTRQVPSRTIEIVAKGDVVESGHLAAATEEVQRWLPFPFSVVEEASSSQNVAIRVNVICERGNSDALIVFPESPRAVVNVAPLRADNPASDRFRERLTKEIWRGLGYALSAGGSVMFPSILKPAFTLAELDKNRANCADPETLNMLLQTAASLGMNQQPVVTYRKACEEGWAPAPTNQAQKVIWDKVHAMPTEPLKIKPETKKVEK